MEKLPQRLIISGLVLIVLGVLIGWVIFPILLEGKIREQLQLRNGSETYEKWRNITIPIFIQFTFFNVTNPKEVENGEVPLLKEIGPFVYRETRLKIIDEIDEEKDTIRYRQAINYFFQPDLSAYETEEVTITVLNLPLVGVVSQIGRSSGIERGIIINTVYEHMKTHSEPLFLQRTIRQLLFGGYKVPLLQELGELKGEELLPNNTFGIYYGKNGTFGTEHVVVSGIKRPDEFGRIVSWNGQDDLTWWGDPYCDKINGTDGSIFLPFVTRDTKLPVFNEEFCRSIYMTYQKDVECQGIPGYRFTMPSKLWQTGIEVPENVCFCAHDMNGNPQCSRSGSLSLASCRKGAPVAASTMYFLHGNKSIQEMYHWEPNVEEHETFVDIEPMTGMVLQAKKRFQVNFEVGPSKSVKGFKKLRTMLFPIVLGEESMVTPSERADELKSKLLGPLMIVSIVKWVLTVSGVLIICLGIALSLKEVKKSNAKNKE